MQQTRIEWVKNPDGTQGYSSNPIRGLCQVGCWYCWEAARRRRFKISPHFEFHRKELRQIENAKGSKGVFLGSAIDLFHESIPYDWRRSVFKTVRACPQHRFYILTKLPQNIKETMPDNVWLGISVTKYQDVIDRMKALQNAEAKTKFVSVEPYLESMGILPYAIDWCIIGKLTGHGKKYDPVRQGIKRLVEICQHDNIPVFLKDNLREIWDGPLIQEFPE